MSIFDERIKQEIGKAYFNDDLAELCRLFRIPIDKDKLLDYKLVEVKFVSEASIEIYNKKTNTKYSASYFVGNCSNRLNCIKVITESDNKRKTELYYTIDEDRVSCEVRLTKGDYRLTLKRERPNIENMYSTLTNDAVVITCSKLDGENQDKGNIIFSKSYQRHDYDGIFYDFEDSSISNGEISGYRYAYIEEGITYGINPIFPEGNVEGVFMENTRIGGISKRIKPDTLCGCLKPAFYETDTQSAIVIAAIYKGSFYKLNIYKKGNSIDIYYSTEAGVKEQKISIPVLSLGTITSEEINNVLQVLSKILPDLMNLISNEFLNFASKIDIRKGLQKHDEDMLSPRCLFNLPFDTVVNSFEGNLEETIASILAECSKLSGDNKGGAQKLLEG